MPPRVAVVLTQLGYGGAEKQTVTLLQRLAGTADAPALVVCLSGDLEPYARVIQDLGYPLVVLDRARSFDLARLWRLRRLLARERIDVVHAVHLLASGYCALATWGSRVQLLPTARGAVARPHPLRFFVYRRMLRRAPFVLVNSDRGARFLVDTLDARESTLRIVPNGIDFAALRARADGAAARATLGVPAGSPLVGYVGKDSPVKNIPRLVAVLDGLLAARPDAHAFLAGTRLDDDARSRLAPSLPRDRVHWLGKRDDVPSLLAAASVVLLTSNSEGCPNVVLEALALGTPVVSTDVGDVRTMVGDGASGDTLFPDEIAAFVAKAVSWIERGDAGRDRVRARGPWLLERYGVEAMVSTTTSIWRSLASRARDRR